MRALDRGPAAVRLNSTPLVGVVLAAWMLWTPASLRCAHSAEVAPLPPAVDLRPDFERWQLPLRSQGARGTCSVFTMVGAFEYALARKQGAGTLLSVEFLNWASNRATTNAADGGFFSDLWSGFLAHGICPEPGMPYQQAFRPDAAPDGNACEDARRMLQLGFLLRWIKPWDVHTGLTDGQFEAIRTTLARQWPVCAGLRWPKTERWEGSILAMAPPEGVFDGHSVLLVGYQEAPDLPGGGLFRIRNSGGGRADGALSYAYARAYMNDAAWIEAFSAAGVEPAVDSATVPSH